MVTKIWSALYTPQAEWNSPNFVKFISKRSLWIASGKYAPLFTFYLIEIQQV